MLSLPLFALLFFCSSKSSSASSDSKNVFHQMEADGIVPEQIEEVPSAKITIVYANGRSVEMGAELTPTEVKDPPGVSWVSEPGKYYTVVMYDPDAPSRQDTSLGDVKHWLVGNVPGSDVARGEVVAEYMGSGPPQGTGLHRYIFLVFEQAGKLDFSGEPRSALNSRDNRLRWSLKEFRKKYGFSKVYAGNYFKAQWDQFVEERKKFVTGSLTA